MIYLQRPCGQLRYVDNIHAFSKSLIDHPLMSKTYCISRDIPLKKMIRWKGYAFEIDKKFTTYSYLAK